MLKNYLSRLNLNPETFDKEKTALILTTLLSGAGLGVLAIVEALGMVKEADESETTDPE